MDPSIDTRVASHRKANYTTPLLTPMSIEPKPRAWVEIDTQALRDNYRAIERVIGPDAKIIPVVKSNGYGLGIEYVIGALEPLGPLAYGVASVTEGAEIRCLGVERPIVVLSPLVPGNEEYAARSKLIATVSDTDALDRWIDACRAAETRAKFHVEVDTGMGRCGFDWRETNGWAQAVYDRCGPDAEWHGVYTHFYGADEPDWSLSRAQWERFAVALDQLPVPRSELCVHVANSAGLLRSPEYAVDAVRPGIYLYGGDPAPGLESGGVPRPRPVVAVRAQILMIRTVSPGSTVGYGATHTAQDAERWGTIGVGYGDGLRRAVGSGGHVIVHGTRVPILGRISMNLTVVDLSDVPETRIGDTATVIGADGDEIITIDDVATNADTVGYEILTGLTPRLPRTPTPEPRARG